MARYIKKEKPKQEIYVNGQIDIGFMAKREYNAFISFLESRIIEHYKSKQETFTADKPP
jgi:flagellar biosynthesis chaperone FliJ